MFNQGPVGLGRAPGDAGAGVAVKPARALAFDLAFLALAVVVVGPPLVAVQALVAWLALPAWLTWALAPCWYVLAVAGIAATAGVVRLGLPRLQPGNWPFPASPQAFAWLLHFGLQRIVNLPLWQPSFFAFASLRWSLLRALGARVAFDVQTAVDLSVVDASMLEVGPGSMLAAGTLVSGHFVEHDRLLLAPVRIGAGVQLMGKVTLAPGCTVGDEAVVGPGTTLLPRVQLGEGAFVGLGCLLHDGVNVGASAVIGHQAVLERDVVVGEGAVVRPFSRVPRGTTVAPGARYPDREEPHP